MSRRSQNREEETEVPTLPSRPAPTPHPAVPNPLPAPVAKTAPYFAAGVVDEVNRNGSAIDPFTGKTVTKADLV